MSRCLVTLAVLAAVAAPHLAQAEPAVIREFEAVARAEPRKDAAALETFAEGAAVSVSEEATNGWRRIRLRDGETGWVEERSLSFPAPPAAAAPAATPPGAAPAAVTPAPLLPIPPARARIYVKDLDHLAELVRLDPEVRPLATRLTSRRTGAYVVAGLGGAISTGLMVHGIQQSERERSNPGDPNFMRTTRGEKAFGAGVVCAVVSIAAGIAIAPTRSNFLDLVNTWNTRHPDQPFTLEHGEVGR